jgi:hypothetical protein
VIGVEGEMEEVEIFGEKTVTWDGLSQETEVWCPTYSEGFRYQAGEDQHQDLEEGS